MHDWMSSSIPGRQRQEPFLIRVFIGSEAVIRFFGAVLPKLVRNVARINAVIMSFYPQCFAVIGHNTDENFGFCSTLPLEEPHFTLRGKTLLQRVRLTF